MIVFVIVNAINVYKKKSKFDFVPILLTIAFILGGFTVITNPPGKFWTRIELSAMEEIYGTPKSGNLTLYSDNSFGATYYNADYSCTFQGNYSLENNVLLLKREDLIEVTDSVFTNKYHLETRDSILIPSEPNFATLRVRYAE